MLEEWLRDKKPAMTNAMAMMIVRATNTMGMEDGFCGGVGVAEWSKAISSGVMLSEYGTRYGRSEDSGIAELEVSDGDWG